MTRCTTYLTLAACVLAVPSALAQQPGQGPQNQPRAKRSALQYNPPSAHAYAGDGYDGTGGEGAYGRGGSTGDSTSAAASSGSGSARAVEVILKASGVPNQNGQVAWPVGLRLLRADSQLQQLEAQLRLAAEQVIASGANPQLLDEIRLNVEDLRQLLLADKERRFSMPLAVYEDAEGFLQKLKRTPKVLAASAPSGRAEATTR